MANLLKVVLGNDDLPHGAEGVTYLKISDIIADQFWGEGTTKI